MIEAEMQGGIVGYWWWTWGNSKSAPSGTNLGVAFNGYSNVDKALSESSGLYNKLPNAKYISIGGGDKDGRFTQSSLNSLTDAINKGKLGAYAGIVYDIEEGDSGLESAFSASFSAAKAKGLKVLVTISNSAPYGIKDGATLMRKFFTDGHIDYISPQLYETGEESSNDYSTNAGVQYSEYAQAKAAIIPSIVSSSMYNSAKSFFSGKGVTCQGYIQWKQV
eukprot:gene24845-30021_t